MSCSVRITLEGLPERVHEIADALDAALPDTLHWHDLAVPGKGFEILLKGTGVIDVSKAHNATALSASVPPMNRSAMIA